MLMSHVNGCHGNHAFFIVQMCLASRKNALHFGGLKNDWKSTKKLSFGFQSWSN